MTATVVVAIDQGTTSTRAIAFDLAGTGVASAQRELPQSYPRPGRVEHDPERIRDDAVGVAREVIEAAEALGYQVAAIGITNQRETTVVWERASGRPIHPAIVWQDRRTANECAALREAGHEGLIERRTGLRLDPYFSGTKLAWILDNVPGAREAAGKGELAFGTIDTWLLWGLTGGRVHATDASNASRTLLYDIDEGRWHPELLELLRVPASVLPEVRDSAGDFGETSEGLFGRAIPLRGVAGDQQAATFGQAAFEPGGMKFTYGTGAFALLNTGADRLASRHGLLTTVAWQLGGRAHVRARGQHLRRRRIGSMAARWTGHHLRRGRDGSARPFGGFDGWGRAGPRLRRAGRHPLGSGSPRRAAGNDARHGAGRDRAGGARGGRLPVTRTDRRDGGRRSPATGYVARGWWVHSERTGRCSFSPTSSTSRSGARR